MPTKISPKVLELKLITEMILLCGDSNPENQDKWSIHHAAEHISEKYSALYKISTRTVERYFEHWLAFEMLLSL
jgi:hypothetical protein